MCKPKELPPGATYIKGVAEEDAKDACTACGMDFEHHEKTELFSRAVCKFRETVNSCPAKADKDVLNIVLWNTVRDQHPSTPHYCMHGRYRTLSCAEAASVPITVSSRLNR